MSDAELLDLLRLAEDELERRWDGAHGERRQLLLAACERVAVARRLVETEPGDQDPRCEG